VLVANRGEIARRVLRTTRALGLRGIAVFSDADATAAHVREADAAVRIGPAPARDSYLSIEAILAAAEATGAEAIHPGYGFLAENAAFAQACEEAGRVFVGPPADAIRLMGSKDAARARMIEVAVPVLPGAAAADVDQDPLAAAQAVGFPLLVKAVAGGGGKGMRVVHSAEDLQPALDAVRREAAAAFGDDAVLFERWLGEARHVEVQIFADAQGRCVHLFDRECSIQRRHQKVLEEAPAPDVPASLRARMAEAAISAAQAVAYRGAGTVEFLLAGDQFYFLEMNTRLQVEHPVTEMITGQDLVAWQFRIAAGEPLPRSQDALVCRGHAIEVRLYAEDPAAGFLPSVGRLDRLCLPDDLPGVRVDTGVVEGDRVGTDYDPMLAKIAARGEDRDQALARLGGALRAARVQGVETNLDLLRALVADDAVRGGPVTTSWLEARAPALRPSRTLAADELAAAALTVALCREADASEPVDRGPFARLRGFRVNRPAAERIILGADGRRWSCRVTRAVDAWLVQVEDAVFRCTGALRERGVDLVIENRARRLEVVWSPHGDAPFISLEDGSGTRRYRLADALASALAGQAPVAGSLEAPMPGQVIAVMVAPGDQVEAGAPLLVVEAMKMEHTLRAPDAGRVRAVHAAVGDRVDVGTSLVELDDITS
jgi:3-methylcrotonyl-CoA carboxylase alpha subunit